MGIVGIAIIRGTRPPRSSSFPTLCLTALSADDSREVVADAMIITAGLWPIANPAARVSAMFEEVPALTRAHVEFRTRLTSLTRTLIDGLLTRARALD
jgi:hypothetical protein